MKKWTTEELEIIKTNYLTMPIASIAEKMGRSKPSVYIKAQELKLIKKPRKAKELAIEPVSTG